MLSRALPDHPEYAATITQVLAIPPKRTTRPVIEFLTPVEVAALLATPDPTTWTGRRDRTLLAMTVQTGLRIGEVCSLTIDDVYLGTGPHVTCTGKGRRQRITPLTRMTVSAMAAYLTERTGRRCSAAPVDSASPGTRSSVDSPNTSLPPRSSVPASTASTSQCIPCGTQQR